MKAWRVGVLAPLQGAAFYLSNTGGVALPPTRDRSTPGYRSCKPPACFEQDKASPGEVFRWYRSLRSLNHRLQILQASGLLKPRFTPVAEVSFGMVGACLAEVWP
jgi:hypothetical protein